MSSTKQRKILGLNPILLTAIFSMLAISISMITFYRQFIYKESKLKARIINCITVSYEDRLELTTMFTNYGETYTSILDVYINFTKNNSYEKPYFGSSRISNWIDHKASEYPVIIEPNKLIYNRSVVGVKYDSLYCFDLSGACDSLDLNSADLKFTAVYAWVHIKVSDEKGNIYAITEPIGKVKLRNKEAVVCRKNCNYRLLSLLKRKYLIE